MSDALIEAVARAIYAQWPNTYQVREPMTVPSLYQWVTKAETWEEMSENLPGRRAELIEAARAALAAIESTGTHVVVPVQMTKEMSDAAKRPKQVWDVPFLPFEPLYDAMLAARPKVTEPQEEICNPFPPLRPGFHTPEDFGYHESVESKLSAIRSALEHLDALPDTILKVNDEQKEIIGPSRAFEVWPSPDHPWRVMPKRWEEPSK